MDTKLGGVPVAVSSMALAWTRAGHQVTILSLDSEISQYLNGVKLTTLGSGLSSYRLNPKLILWLLKYGDDYDKIILNGLWQFQSFGACLALWLKQTPYAIFPHGMLDPWFKKRYPLKHLKKILYWFVAEYWVLSRARAVLFTAEDELILAQRSFPIYDVKPSLVTLGIEDPLKSADSVVLRAKCATNLKSLLFLARLDEKKGLDMLVDALIYAWSDSELLDVQLIIAGPGESSNYVAKLKLKLTENGFSDKVTWLGMVSGERKWKAFESADAYILPSHQENFGLSVVESLAFKLPVLITKRINIWREIVSAGAGFASENSVEGIYDLLIQWRSLSNERSDEMSEAARALFENRYLNDVASEIILEGIRNCTKEKYHVI